MSARNSLLCSSFERCGSSRTITKKGFQVTYDPRWSLDQQCNSRRLIETDGRRPWQTTRGWAHHCATFAFLIALFALPRQAVGQSESPLKPLDTSSPRATLQSFWEQSAKVEQSLTAYRQDQSFDQYFHALRTFGPVRQLFDLSETPEAFKREVGGASFSYLHDVLVRLPPVDPKSVPGGPGFDPEAVQEWTYPDTEIVIRRIEEGPNRGKYQFSAATVKRLPDFYQAIIELPAVRSTDYPNAREEVLRFTGPLFPLAVADQIPSRLRFNLLGTPLWKVFFTLLAGLVIIVVTGLWARLAGNVSAGGSAVRRLLCRLSVPVVLASLIYVSHSLLIELQLNISGSFAQMVSFAVSVGLSLALAWAAWLFVHLTIETIIALPSIPEQSYDAHLLRLLARVLGGLAATGVIVWGANEIGIPAAGLLAGLGVGGFALALAAQSTVENLFGGVSIFADRPFRVGDFIHYGNSDGVVEMIGPRSSRIRGLDSTLTTVPNSDLSKMHITNYSMRNKCFFHHILGVRYETTPDQFDGLLSELRDRVAAHPMVEETSDFPRIRLLRFGEFSIDIDVRAYVLTTDFAEFLSVQQELLLDTMRVVDEAGSGFAFPSVTNYLQDDRGIRSVASQRASSVPSVSNDQVSQTDRVAHSGISNSEGPPADEGPPAEDDL